MIRVTIREWARTVSFHPSSFAELPASQEVQLTLGLEQPQLVGSPVEDLEAHQVQMNGMGTVSGIDECPDFSRSKHWPLSYRHLPVRST